jgi:hypothetical protein
MASDRPLPNTHWRNLSLYQYGRAHSEGIWRSTAGARQVSGNQFKTMFPNKSLACHASHHSSQISGAPILSCVIHA